MTISPANGAGPDDVQYHRIEALRIEAAQCLRGQRRDIGYIDDPCVYGVIEVVVDIGNPVAESHDLSLQSLWVPHVLELAHFFKPLAVRGDAVAGLIGEIESKEHVTVSTLTALEGVDHAEAL
jgi:hypothetical protein